MRSLAERPAGVVTASGVLQVAPALGSRPYLAPPALAPQAHRPGRTRPPCAGAPRRYAQRAASEQDGLSLGAVALDSDVLRPDDGATVPAGHTQVFGYAFAGDDRQIARVDVSTDGGASWVQADLDEQPSPWSWRLWRTTVDLPPGRTEIDVRAWDTYASCSPPARGCHQRSPG